MAPLIGVTTRTAPISSSKLNYVMAQQSYTSAIIQAGGIPVLIPSDIPLSERENLVYMLDGILFTGGGDIAVHYFYGVNHPAVYGIEQARDEIELDLVKLAVKNSTPFLGICRGLQVINVALGGTLYTHIPDQLNDALVHDYPGEDGLSARTAIAHTIQLASSSIISEIMGEVSLKVNSLHHQGIKDTSSLLFIAGSAPDGLVEAVELRDHPFGIAVQWHPEWLTDQIPTQKLFSSFVKASEKNRLLKNGK